MMCGPWDQCLISSLDAPIAQWEMLLVGWEFAICPHTMTAVNSHTCAHLFTDNRWEMLISDILVVELLMVPDV